MKRFIHHWLDMPPLWMLLFLAVIWRQSLIWNPLGFDNGLIRGAGWGLILAALALMGWASVQFVVKRTSIVPRNRPKALIAEGPYRISRNPIYLADAMVVLGFALVMGSAIGVILVPVFMWIIQRRFILGEEAGLRTAYPDQSQPYFTATRRWL